MRCLSPFQFAACLLLVGVLAADAPGQPQQPKLTAEQGQQLKQADDLNSEVVKLHEQGKMRDAIPLAMRILQIHQRILGDEHADTATSLNNLGFLLNSQGDYTAARAYYEHALKIRKKVLGEEHVDTATSLDNLGGLLFSHGDYATARLYLEQSLKIRNKVLGEENPDTALSLNNLGCLLQAQGDHAAARLYFEQALKIRKKVMGDMHSDTATSLNNIGFLLKSQGDYATARTYYEQALKIFRKVKGEEHPDTAASLSNLGALLHSQGDYAKARPYFEEALKIIRMIKGEEHADTATLLNNLGILLMVQHKHAAAKPYYEQALRIRKRVLGEEHPATAQSLNTLGALLHLQGDYTAARAYYEHALKIQRKVLGEEHPDTATSLNNLGVLLDSQGDFVAARPYHEQALKIRNEVLGEEHPDTVQSFYNLATLDVALGNWANVATQIDLARRGIRRHVVRVLPALSILEQLAFLDENYKRNVHTALTLAILPEMEPSATLRSAAWLINGKAVAQESLVSRTLLTRDLGDPDSAAIAGELLEIRRQLAALTLSSPKPGQEALRQQQLAELGEKEDELARKLAAKGQLPADAGQWIETDRVREALEPDEVFVDIARFDVFNFQAKGQENKWQPAHYAAWITPAAGQGDVQIVDLGPADAIEQAVAAVRKSLQGAALRDGPITKRGEPAVEKELQAELQRVADLVWKPIAGKLGTAKKLVVSPDASLWLLPWAALPVGDGKYLIEDYSLRLVVSGRDLVAKSPDVTTTQPALFADPAFDLGVAEILGSIKALFPKMALPGADGTRSLSEKHGLPRVAALPGTATELQAISPSVEKLTGKKPQVYAGRYALETVVKNVHRPPVLVLSTHGFFLPDQETKPDERLAMLGNETRAVPLTVDGKPIENPLLRCGLLLAGCNQRQSAGGDDGVLTGLEICGIDLRGTDLVVLSACETGIGTIRNGEGVAGLRQAFQLAGAKSVVATLWQIPDVESARIMNDFFANLAAGQSKAEALRNSQLKRIAARREKYGAAHPYFWAAYTLTGQ